MDSMLASVFASISLVAIFAVIQLQGTPVTSQPEVGTKNVTVHYCPYPCKIGNISECFPVPCPMPPCVDGQKLRPDDCCKGCPDGPNCQGPDGHIIRWNHWQVIDGKNCTCTQPPSTATCK